MFNTSNDLNELIKIIRFLHVAVASKIVNTGDIVGVGRCGENDNGYPSENGVVLDDLQDFAAALSRQVQIQDDQVWQRALQRSLSKDFERLLAVDANL